MIGIITGRQNKLPFVFFPWDFLCSPFVQLITHAIKQLMSVLISRISRSGRLSMLETTSEPLSICIVVLEEKVINKCGNSIASTTCDIIIIINDQKHVLSTVNSSGYFSYKWSALQLSVTWESYTHEYNQAKHDYKPYIKLIFRSILLLQCLIIIEKCIIFEFST